jgi:hypothetical protein
LALARVCELAPRWAKEFNSDADVLQSKLTLVRDLLDADR